jgi:hypothetical protein
VKNAGAAVEHDRHDGLRVTGTSIPLAGLWTTGLRPGRPVSAHALMRRERAGSGGYFSVLGGVPLFVRCGR